MVKKVNYLDGRCTEKVNKPSRIVSVECEEDFYVKR